MILGIGFCIRICKIPGITINLYNLISIYLRRVMKVEGSKIIFGLGVASAVATAVVALYFAIQ
jgi:hypothetical protein